MRSPMTWLEPLALFLLAVAVRSIPAYRVFVGDAIVPFGNDSAFHLRQIARGVAAFPGSPGSDPYIHFPYGAMPIVSPLFDWVLVLLLGPFVHTPNGVDTALLERIAIWIPPVLGGLVVVLTWWVVRRSFGALPARIAGLVLALLSAHAWYSQIGFIDHHVAVSGATTLLLGTALWLVAAHAADDDRARRLAGLAFGLAASAAFLLWPGSLLHVTLLDLPILGILLLEARRDAAQKLAGSLAAGHALAALVLTPFGLAYEWPHLGRFSPTVLSAFQPWLMGTAAACLALSSWAFAQPRLGATRLARSGAFGSIGLALFLASGIGIGATEGLDAVRQWLVRSDSYAFYQGIGETQPLLVMQGRLDWQSAAWRLSYFFFVFPLVVVLLMWRARGSRELAPLVVVSCWSLGTFAATLLQRRFFNSFSVGLAIVFGLAAAEGFRTLRARLEGAGMARAAAPATAILTLLLLLPTLDVHRGDLQRLVRWLDQPRSSMGERHVRSQFTEFHVATWLRDNTPDPGGWLDADVTPDYGVLAPWHLGHVLKYKARRPVVVDNFAADVGGGGLDWSLNVLAMEESAAVAALEGSRIRYVVVEPRLPQGLKQAPRRSLVRSLLFFNGSERGATASTPMVPALTRFRIVYPLGPAPPKPYRVYELVTGALLEGNAAPGQRVLLELPLYHDTRRVVSYRASARADAEGRYAFRVPYTTVSEDGGRGGRLAARYRLRSQGRKARVGVSEDDVTTGNRVAVPELAPG